MWGGRMDDTAQIERWIEILAKPLDRGRLNNNKPHWLMRSTDFVDKCDPNLLAKAIAHTRRSYHAAATLGVKQRNQGLHDP
jgi:hypothetical protein